MGQNRGMCVLYVVWSVKTAACLGHFGGRGYTQMERLTMDESYINSNVAHCAITHVTSEKLPAWGVSEMAYSTRH